MAVQKACLILGAGASYDVGGEGAPTNSEYRPPLAVDLFDIHQHVIYWHIMQRYNGAVVLGQSLAPQISSGAISIEKALRQYAEHQDNEIKRHFKHIPAYLRDLIYFTTKNFTPAPSSYIQLVQKLLAEYPHDILFLILNYDNLLEVALSKFKKEFWFRRIGHYVSDERSAKVVKLHGSIDWFRCLPGGGNADWDSVVEQFDIFAHLPEHELIVEGGIDEVRATAFKDHRVYPILTAPLAGKCLTDAVCPTSHIKAARQFIRECSKFLIIGTSGLDEDLLELLDTTINPMQGILLHIVGKDSAAAEAHGRFVKGVRAFQNLPRGIELLTVYNKGFSKYLTSKQFQDFATFRM